MNASPPVLRAIGLMSGTSMDGVDAAVLETDGEKLVRFGPTGGRPYTPEERALLEAAVDAARPLNDRNARPGLFAEAERMTTAAHTEAVTRLLKDSGLAARDIDVVGFHGQTVLHRPDFGLTIQLGDGPDLARRLGINVVHDLRAADMAAGGQGAPLVPIYHGALAAATGLDLPVAIVNIGGVANVTFLDGGDPIAFDTGPGNALLDDWTRRHTGQAFDRGGRLALSGSPDAAALTQLMADSYFLDSAPKSLDRNAFSLNPIGHLSAADGAATLAAFTAASIAIARRHLPARPKRWIVAGGGARNPAIMAALAAELDAPVEPADALGWAADHIEAQAFAFLAVRSLRGLPLTFPSTTGVPAPCPGGVLASVEPV